MTNQKLVVGGLGLLSLMGLYFYATRGTSRDRLTRKDLVANPIEEDVTVSGRFIDLTAKITKNTVVYPGDPTFCTSDVCSLEQGHSYGLQKMEFGNHTGTHIDFPAHVIRGGKTSSDYSIEELIGDGLIIEVPRAARTVSTQFLKTQNQIFAGAFVFFKTANSTQLNKQANFVEDFVYIEPDAAQFLVDLKVKVVGIDYISVDSPREEKLPVHQILLSNDVLIVEGLELSHINSGKCKIHIAPLNIPDMDGLPARVFAKQ